jgi:hypothetical protein
MSFFRKLGSAFANKVTPFFTSVDFSKPKKPFKAKTSPPSIPDIPFAENKAAPDFRTLDEIIAAERRKMLANIEEQGRLAQEEVERQHSTFFPKQHGSDEPLYAFVSLQKPLVNGVDFSSSNVEQVWYKLDEEEMWVQFQDGSVYKYWTITTQEAANMFHATSKGIYIWDAYRIRGTVLGHKKNYLYVGPGGTVSRRYNESQEARDAHMKKVERQSLPGVFARSQAKMVGKLPSWLDKS